MTPTLTDRSGVAVGTGIGVGDAGSESGGELNTDVSMKFTVGTTGGGAVVAPDVLVSTDEGVEAVLRIAGFVLSTS